MEEDEKIIYVAHRHWFIYFKASFKAYILGIAAPLLFYYLFPGLYFVSLAWGAIGFLAVLYHLIDWYFDAWILTNTGIIDIEKNGIFDKSSTRIEYHMIEGISYNINGFWPIILNFGQIIIDKIGMNTQVILEDAANPKKLERRILKAQEKYVSERSVRDHSALKDMLSEMIAYHVTNNKINTPKE